MIAAFAIGFVALSVAGHAIAAQVPTPVERPKLEEVGNAPLTGNSDLDRLEAEIAAQKRALERNRNNGDLQGQAISLGLTVQARELAVAVARDNIDVLTVREAKIHERLKAQRGHLSETLAALEMLERQRPPALAVQPEDAAQAVRSAILLGTIVPRLKHEAETLAKELSDLRVIRQRIEAEQRALEAAADALKRDETNLDKLMSRKAEEREAIRSFNRAQEAHLAELARRAENLSALIEGLRDDKAGAPRARPTMKGRLLPQGQEVAGIWASPGAAPRSFAEARGRLRLPAVGKVVEKFGVPNESGGLTKGIKLGTLTGAHVVMPFDGRVKYAGPLKTYGQVLIVEAGDDYLIILAGMARIDAAVGQWLLAGEPVGRMAEKGEDGPKELYLEFRHGREPFDPVPWLAGVTKEG